jgi:short-subunit dehydrogenase
MTSSALWRGKTVLVTGGSSGIGRAVCVAVAAAGGRVGIVARRPSLLDETAALLRGRGGVVETAACDAADPVALAAAVERLEGLLGSTDVAIACAGTHRESWPLDAQLAKEVFDANIGPLMAFCAAVLPGMLDRRRGRICGVASIAAAVGLPGNAAYCASKAAAVAFLESLRIDCRPRGIRVTTACPGFVDTPMVTDEERARGGLMTADDAARRILRAIERGRPEAWFPWHTALGARLARGLPPAIRDAILRRTPPMKQASR